MTKRRDDEDESKEKKTSKGGRDVASGADCTAAGARVILERCLHGERVFRDSFLLVPLPFDLKTLVRMEITVVLKKKNGDY